MSMQARAAAKDGKIGDGAPHPVGSTTLAESAAVVTVAVVTSKTAPNVGTDEGLPTAKKQKRGSAVCEQDDTAEANEDEGATLTNGQAALNPSFCVHNLEKVKWKKLANQVLVDNKGSMKLTKLQKQLRLAAKVSTDSAAVADALISARLIGSSQFVVKGKTVCLTDSG